jgi:tetratricopeptide (TPR) repeat protein
MPDRVLLIGVPVLMLALFGVDRRLARLEQTELEQEAKGLFSEGSSLLKAGKAQDAVERLRRAHSMVRTNTLYALALAEAGLQSGQEASAQRVLDEVLQTDSNNARANLLMARLFVSRNDFSGAEPYYHRAIYGRWAQNEPGFRLDARFEWARVLAGHGSQQELLSELLLLQAAAPDTPAIQKDLAGLFLRAGSGTRAAPIFRSLIRQRPADAEAYAGLGQAESLMNNYHAAELAFANAVFLKPGDKEIASRAESVKRLASLDPTPRRLSSLEKFRRSAEILKLSDEALRACFKPGGPPPESIKLLDGARRLESEHPGTATNERAEARLDSALAIWQARPPACRPEDAALAVIMQKLAQ